MQVWVATLGSGSPGLARVNLSKGSLEKLPAHAAASCVCHSGVEACWVGHVDGTVTQWDSSGQLCKPMQCSNGPVAYAPPAQQHA